MTRTTGYALRISTGAWNLVRHHDSRWTGYARRFRAIVPSIQWPISSGSRGIDTGYTASIGRHGSRRSTENLFHLTLGYFISHLPYASTPSSPGRWWRAPGRIPGDERQRRYRNPGIRHHSSLPLFASTDIGDVRARRSVLIRDGEALW